MRFELRPHQLSTESALIYMREIHDLSGVLIGRYVGKAKAGASRPLKHYRRNVANMLLGKPYRKKNPDGYRRIHRALAEAELKNHRVTLQFLRNVRPHEDIDQVEQECIRAHNSQGPEAWQLNG